MRYVQKPRHRTGFSHAARYEYGQPLDELLAVARKMGSDSMLDEAPALRVLVVRYLRVPDGYPATIDYEVVEDGDYLVYSETADVLYASDATSFESEHEMRMDS